jgi:uncharacterized protein (TIGR03437 family)
MRKNRKFLITKIVLIAAVVPFIIYAYEYGPPPAYTGAPGDNKTGCIASGCHVGTPNSGTGSVKILLPDGSAPTTYTPGQAMTLLVQITDSTKAAYGFQLTARSGASGTAQAGDFSTIELNGTPCTYTTSLGVAMIDSACPVQVFCPDGSQKANGSLCNSLFPTQYIEHTFAGYQASLAGKGSFTYSFSWTPPATASGNITMYVAGNAGPAGPPVQTPTNVYLSSSTVLTPVAGSGPSISNVQDAESARTSVVPGEWIAIYGSGLAGTTRTWAAADFNNGSNLPMSLSGVSVQFGTLPAAVYFISATQIDVQAPSGITGTVPVTVTNNGAVSAAFNTTVVANAPALFYYPGGSNVYPAATHLNGSLIGDPAVTPGTTKAAAGETIVMYVNGLAASPSGVIISSPISYSGTVTVNVGSTAAKVTFAGLVAAGEYQLNVQLPTGLAPGNYPVSVAAQGQTSSTGITLPVGP